MLHSGQESMVAGERGSYSHCMLSKEAEMNMKFG